jgi:hypothetical protein
MEEGRCGIDRGGRDLSDSIFGSDGEHRLANRDGFRRHM